ncbi:MAG: hypothetical protein WCJ33_08870 [Pseudomonadota bacterium]
MSMKLGIYETCVKWVTAKVKPHLHKITDDFASQAVEDYKKNPENSNEDIKVFSEISKFEIQRRGYGPGITQDVAEPIVATVVNIGYAAIILTITESLKNKTLKMIGGIATFGLVANQLFNLFRTIPRYIAGLQGSLEMAFDRCNSIKYKGFDPLAKQSERKIEENPEKEDISPNESANSSNISNKTAQFKRPEAPTSLMDRASSKPLEMQL